MANWVRADIPMTCAASILTNERLHWREDHNIREDDTEESRDASADLASGPIGTSIGANDCEADEAVSKKEFKVKICTCRKESRETKFHLRMIATAVPDLPIRQDPFGRRHVNCI